MAAHVPEKKKSGVGAFFLSLLKCLCYFAVFFGSMTVIQAVYTVAVMFFVPNMGMDHSGYVRYSQEYWNVFSKNICWVTIASYAVAFLVYLIFFACRKKKLSEEAVDKAEMLRRKQEWSKGVAKFSRQRNKEIW